MQLGSFTLSWSLTLVVMDSLVFPLNSIRLKIKSFFLFLFFLLSWIVWLMNYSSPILKYLGITTNCNNYFYYTTLTALKVRDTCLWYLDSGCCRHIIGNKALFKTLFERKIGTVTFGDGSKSVICGMAK